MSLLALGLIAMMRAERTDACGVYGRAGKAEHAELKAVMAEVISINADASSPQERTESSPEEGSTAYSSAVESPRCGKEEPSPDSQSTPQASTLQCHSCGTAVSHDAEGSQGEEGKATDTERESGAVESAGLVEFTQADREAIATALRDEDACGKEAEQIWQVISLSPALWSWLPCRQPHCNRLRGFCNHMCHYASLEAALRFTPAAGEAC